MISTEASLLSQKYLWDACYYTGEFAIITGDCLNCLDFLGRWKPRLIFADPPYNQGIDYGAGRKTDKLPCYEYIRWCAFWLKACLEALADDGSLWVLISDEYAAQYVTILDGLGMHRRNWIKWHESFGTHQRQKFGRCSRHLLYYVKDLKRFVFNSEAVRVPSARQTQYNDKRANPAGKIMDDVWLDIPRLAGTHKERIKGFKTQLPVKLLERIIAVASEPGDLVIDPFSGSGTTGVAALRLGRQYVGVEKNAKYAKVSIERLKSMEK